MANTLRKTAVSSSPAGDGRLGLPGDRPKHSTLGHSPRQEGRPPLLYALEAAASLLEGTAKTAANLHNRCAGSTVNLINGNLTGSARFAVSIYPERSVELITPPTWELLYAYAAANFDLLRLTDHALGTWVDALRNRHVLDVVICPAALGEAISLGTRHQQQAIFDLQAGEVISLVAAYADGSRPAQAVEAGGL